MFDLRFDKNQIEYWTSRYVYPREEYIAETVAPRMKQNGYLSREDFLAICDWKTPRTRKHVEKNSAAFISEVSRIALSTPNENLRIEILTLLKGVNWPTASVILHFGHTDPYPIIDFRALWSLGVEIKQADYNFELWQEYTNYCRKLAFECNVCMRTLDKALWQYSKENQEKAANKHDFAWEESIPMGTMISLPYGGNVAAFPVDDLIAYMQSTGRPYIIQGAVHCALANHPKLQSLDCWLRSYYTDRKDTAQAVREVIDALVETGKFEAVDDLVCPDSGRRCKGIRLVI